MKQKLLTHCMLLVFLLTSIYSKAYSATENLETNGRHKVFISSITDPCPTPAPTALAQSFCNSGTVANLTATGTALQWYNAETGGTPLSNATALTTGTYYVSQTAEGCESLRTAVSVTVASTLTASVTISSSDIQHNNTNNTNYVCAGGSVTFTAVAVNAGNNPSYEWLVNNQVQEGQTTSTFTRTFTGLAQVRCRITVTPGHCATQATVQSSPVILDPVSIPAVTVVPQGSTTFCEGGSVILQSGGQIDTNSTWLRNGAFYANVLPGNSSITVTQSGTYTLFINGYNGYNCTNTSAPVTVTVSPAPATPVVSSQNLCSGTTVANLTAQGTNIKWYDVAEGGVALSIDAPLVTGTYYVTQNVGCESTRVPVAVTVTPQVTPLVSISQISGSEYICAGESGNVSFEAYVTNAGNNPTYEWLVNNVVQTGFTTATFNYNATENSIITVRITVSPELICTTAQTIISNEVAVTFVNTTAQITVQGATTFCPGGSVELLSSGIGSNGIGIWVKNSDYYADAYDDTPLTVTESGIYHLEVYSEYGCQASSEEVTVTVIETPAPVAEAQNFCGGATVANLTATGTAIQWYTTPEGGSALSTAAVLNNGTYYASQTLNGCESPRTEVSVTVNATAAPVAAAQGFCGGGTVADLTATGTGIQWYSAEIGGLPLATTTTLENGTYYASQTLNGCESIRTAVTVSVTTTAQPAVQPQSFCNSATVASLAATGTAIKWYNTATGGSPLAANTALLTGTYYATQTLNNCESARTEVAIIINTTPAPTASPQTYCIGTTVASLVANGTAVKWYLIASGGTALGPNSTVANRTYYVSQTLNGCESSRTAVAITIITTAQPSASAQTYCNGATVANLTATGTAIQWYTTATGGTALATATTLASGTYYATQTLNSCESARRAVTITINTTAAPVASAQNFCNSANVSNLTATGNGIKWYNNATGGTALTAATALSTGTYYASQTLNNCEGPRTTVNVTITTTPAPSAPAQTLCNGATVANLVATGTAVKWYTTATGGTALGTSATLAAGTYYASQTINGCEGPRIAVAVSLQQPVNPSLTVNSNDLNYNENTGFYTVCGGGSVTFEAIAADAGISPSFEWYVNGELQPGNNGNLFSTVLSQTGYLFVSATVTVSPEACAQQPTVGSEELLIDLIDAPYVAIIAQGPTTFCQGGSVFLQAAGAENYEGVWLRDGNFYDYVMAGINEVIEVTVAGVYTLDVAGYDGCAGSSAPVTVTETIPVTPAVSLLANVTGPIAAGTPVTFTATPSNGGTAPYYDFKVNGTTTQSGTSATYTTSTLNNGNVVTVQLTSNASCATSQIAVSNGITMIINGPGTVTPEPGEGGIIYVKKNATGNGTSWADALGEIADALKYAKQVNDATPGAVSQIWVAGGKYTPMYSPVNLSGDNAQGRNNTFLLVNNVKVYGGFAGTETAPAQRDLTLTANASVLSGDFLGNDGSGLNTENAYHVVMAIGTSANPITPATALDGFTITGGFGNASGVINVNGANVNNNSGGGIYNANAAVAYTNILLKDNKVIQSGGGIYNLSSAVSLTNMLIAGNSSTNGGGIYNISSPAILTNVTMSANTVTNASNIGGAIYNTFSSPQVRNSIIFGNGSGVFNSSAASAPQYAYSLVQGINSTTNGNVAGTSNPLFTNTATGDYSFQIASPALNRGNNTYYATGSTPDLSGVIKDLAGGQRIYNGGTIDMGAYEFQQDCAIATTWNGTSWSNGVPTSYIYTATIAGNYTTGSITACSLVVTAGNVTLAPGVTFTIKGAVTVNPGASFTLQNNAALVQQDNVANTGAITVIKNSNPLYRLDYTLWSSPVAGQNLLAFSPQTSVSRFYEYKYGISSTSNSYVEQYFQVDPATTSFEAAKGFMIRMPNGNTAPGYNVGNTAITHAGTFAGVAHNGTYERTASIEGDRYTLVGNPYPSPISVADFFNGNTSVVDGSSALYFWRKRNDAASSSYATLNLSGFTSNQGPDGGSEQAIFYTGANSNWLIAQGQGFLVRTKENPTGSNITFANSMRRPVPTTGNQSFFRTAASAVAQETMSRYWINLSTAEGNFSQAMVAYREDATTGLDYGYDGQQLNDGGRTSLFSLAQGTALAIQSRPAFTATDVVTMGFTTATAGDFTLTLDNMDGLFEQGQDIFLKDNLVNLTHNLSEGDYNFAAEAGTFNERFEIVYATEALGTTNPTLNPSSVIVFKEGNAVTVNTGLAQIKGITIYDIRGSRLYQKDGINATEITIDALQVQQQVLILEISTDKGSVSKRIIF